MRVMLTKSIAKNIDTKQKSYVALYLLKAMACRSVHKHTGILGPVWTQPFGEHHCVWWLETLVLNSYLWNDSFTCYSILEEVVI